MDNEEILKYAFFILLGVLAITLTVILTSEERMSNYRFNKCANKCPTLSVGVGGLVMYCKDPRCVEGCMTKLSKRTPYIDCLSKCTGNTDCLTDQCLNACK